jgi:hypothetical protein
LTTLANLRLKQFFLTPLLTTLANLGYLQTFFPDVNISAWADDVILSFNYKFTNPQIAKNTLLEISETLKVWAVDNKAIFAPNKSEVYQTIPDDFMKICWSSTHEI